MVVDLGDLGLDNLTSKEPQVVVVEAALVQDQMLKVDLQYKALLLVVDLFLETQDTMAVT
jgi:hypothetical protein